VTGRKRVDRDFRVLPGVRKYSQKADITDKISTRSLLYLMLAGLVLRLFMLPYRFAASFDEINYLKLGVSGARHGFDHILHTYWSPLLPACIAFFAHFVGNYETAARLVSILAGVLTLIPIYSIGRAVFNEKVGIVAAGFFALFPPLAFQSTSVLTEPLVMLSGGFAVFFGMRMLQRHSVANALLAGICAGLAYLAHPAGFGFLVLLGGWLIVGQMTRLFTMPPLRLAYLLPALAVGFLIFAAPYLRYLKSETGGWTLSAKGAANLQMETENRSGEDPFRSLNPDNTEVPIDLVFHQGTFLRQTSLPDATPVREVKLGGFAAKFARNFANVLQRGVPQVLTTLPLIFFGLGLFGSVWRGKQGKLVLYLMSFIVFYWLILVPCFHIHLRYLSPVWPICAVFIGTGVMNLHEWLSSYMPLTKFAWRKSFSASSLAAGLILTGFGLLSFLPETGRVMARTPVSTESVADPVGQRAAGLWLGKHTSVTPVIMSRNHAVDFYAGNYDISASVTIPKNGLARVLAYARNRNVSHLVVSERYANEYPDLVPLLSEDFRHEHLNRIYRQKDESGLVTVIYELK